MRSKWTLQSNGARLVGRDGELEQCFGALGEAMRGEPRLLLVTGPAGIGKTALVRTFAGDAPVVAITGEQHEVGLAFGLVDQLVSELAHRAGASGEASAEAARGAVDQHRDADSFSVGAWVLELLGEAARDTGLILVVDDAHWADRASLQALTFAFRRLRTDAVLCIVVCREEGLGLLPSGLLRLVDDVGTRLTLDGLSEEELISLAAAVNGTALQSAAARRLHRHTLGNPLYATALIEELAGTLNDGLGGRDDVALPAPRSFANVMTGRLLGCSPATRDLVEGAAVLGVRCRWGDAVRLVGVDEDLSIVDEALAAGLFMPSSNTGDVVFAHPLVRAAVYRQIPPSRRRDLHLLAAVIVDAPEQSLEHRIAASQGPDAALAKLAADLGRDLESHHSWEAAASAFAAAARACQTDTERGAHLLARVECLLIGGFVREAGDLIPEIEVLEPSPSKDLTLGHLALLQGRLDEAASLLARGWRVADQAGDRLVAARSAAELSHILINQGRSNEAVTAATFALAGPTPDLVSGGATTTRCLGLAALGRAEEGITLLGDLPETLADLTGTLLEATVGRGILRLWSDDLDGARADLRRGELASRRRGPLHMRILSLMYGADAEYRAGAWDESALHAGLAVSLARDAEHVWTFSLVHSVASLTAASRAQWEDAEHHVREAKQAALQLGDMAAVLWSAVAAAGLARARGNAGVMLEELEPLLDVAHLDGMEQPTIQPWRALFVEALIGVGRTAEALERLDPFDALAAGRPSLTAVASRLRAQALAAERRYDEAASVLSAALEIEDRSTRPFDTALSEMTHGVVLRRLGQRREARGQLGFAARTFRSLRAAPYLARCERELAACGARTARGGDLTWRGPIPTQRDQLTPQETAVATLVASGITNREVAGELVVSVKTVEYHLGHVFSKLGVSTRAQLAATFRSAS